MAGRKKAQRQRPYHNQQEDQTFILNKSMEPVVPVQPQQSSTGQLPVPVIPSSMDDSEKIESLKSLNQKLLEVIKEERMKANALWQSKKVLEYRLSDSFAQIESLRSELLSLKREVKALGNRTNNDDHDRDHDQGGLMIKEHNEVAEDVVVEINELENNRTLQLQPLAADQKEKDVVCFPNNLVFGEFAAEMTSRLKASVEVLKEKGSSPFGGLMFNSKFCDQAESSTTRSTTTSKMVSRGLRSNRWVKGAAKNKSHLFGKMDDMFNKEIRFAWEAVAAADKQYGDKKVEELENKADKERKVDELENKVDKERKVDELENKAEKEKKVDEEEKKAEEFDKKVDKEEKVEELDKKLVEEEEKNVEELDKKVEADNSMEQEVVVNPEHEDATKTKTKKNLIRRIVSSPPTICSVILVFGFVTSRLR